MKCQELAFASKNGNNSTNEISGNSAADGQNSNKELEQMMNNFTHLLQGFAFQLAAKNV
jgi:hypothetical protein